MPQCLLRANQPRLARDAAKYISPIWSPNSVQDIDIIENVQRRFTKLFLHLHSLPYSTRLTRLGLSSLQVYALDQTFAPAIKLPILLQFSTL